MRQVRQVTYPWLGLCKWLTSSTTHAALLYVYGEQYRHLQRMRVQRESDARMVELEMPAVGEEYVHAHVHVMLHPHSTRFESLVGCMLARESRVDSRGCSSASCAKYSHAARAFPSRLACRPRSPRSRACRMMYICRMVYTCRIPEVTRL